MLLRTIVIGATLASAIVNASANEVRFGNGDFVAIEQGRAANTFSPAYRANSASDARTSVPTRLGHQ